MVERCKNCGSKVYLEGRYCPYCGSELEGYKEEKLTPAGKKIALILAIFISLCFLIPSSILMYAVFTHIHLVSFEILIFFILLALFMLPVGGRIVNKVLSKKEFYEPLTAPNFDPSEGILDEIKFLLLGSYSYIYNLFFTDHHILFCYLDEWYMVYSGFSLGMALKNLTLRRRLEKEDEELQLLKNNLINLVTYNGNNFYISYNDIEEIIFKKNGFRIKLFSEKPLIGSKNITLFTTYIKFANQERADILALFKKYFPNRVREEEGRFLNI